MQSLMPLYLETQKLHVGNKLLQILLFVYLEDILQVTSTFG